MCGIKIIIISVINTLDSQFIRTRFQQMAMMMLGVVTISIQWFLRRFSAQNYHSQRSDNCDYQQFHLAQVLFLISFSMTLHFINMCGQFCLCFRRLRLHTERERGPVASILSRQCTHTDTRAHTHHSYEIKIKVCTNEKNIVNQIVRDTMTKIPREQSEIDCKLHRQLINE